MLSGSRRALGVIVLGVPGVITTGCAVTFQPVQTSTTADREPVLQSVIGTRLTVDAMGADADGIRVDVRARGTTVLWMPLAE